MCCYGHILHPISTDLLLLCGVLMTTVGERWLALISFVSLIMCLSQPGLPRASCEPCINPCTTLCPRWTYSAQSKGKSSLTCREVRSIRLQGQKAQHESSLKDDVAQGHIYRLAQWWLQLSGLAVIGLAPCNSIEINYSANNFWGPHFCDIEPLHSLLIASV